MNFFIVIGPHVFNRISFDALRFPGLPRRSRRRSWGILYQCEQCQPETRSAANDDDDGQLSAGEYFPVV
jgi:hypothetical protein